MASPTNSTVLSCMLCVPHTPAAVSWYEKAIGARVLWSLGSVAGLQVGGAAFFLHEPVSDTFASPIDVRITTVRVELFVDDPDAIIARAVEAGGVGQPPQDHAAPWGVHRQGKFTDPFGHVWHVGDKSPLNPFRG